MKTVLPNRIVRLCKHITRTYIQAELRYDEVLKHPGDPPKAPALTLPRVQGQLVNPEINLDKISALVVADDQAFFGGAGRVATGRWMLRPKSFSRRIVEAADLE